MHFPSGKLEPFQKSLPSYENKQLLKAHNIIYDSRIQDLMLLSLKHPPHSMQVITL